MKDKLGRDIIKGQLVAYAAGSQRARMEIGLVLEVKEKKITVKTVNGARDKWSLNKFKSHPQTESNILVLSFSDMPKELFEAFKKANDK